MADEFIIYEMNWANEAKTVMTPPHKTQVLDLATASAKIDDSTEIICVKANGTALWYKFGDSSVSATANTDGNMILFSNEAEWYFVGKNSNLYIDTAADA